MYKLKIKKAHKQTQETINHLKEHLGQIKIVRRLKIRTCLWCWQSCLLHRLCYSTLYFLLSNETNSCRWHLCWRHWSCCTAHPVSTNTAVHETLILICLHKNYQCDGVTIQFWICILHDMASTFYVKPQANWSVAWINWVSRLNLLLPPLPFS